MAGIDVVQPPPSREMKALGRGQFPRLNFFQPGSGNSKKKLRTRESTSHLEKCGNLAATPTTSVASESHQIGGSVYFRQDNFQEDY